MKELKRLFLFLVIVVSSTMLFAACGDDDDDGTGGLKPSVSGLKLTETALAFDKNGGTKSFSAQAAERATATASASWLTVTTGELSPVLKATPITVTAAANTDYDERTATITVTAGSESATISVTQTADDGLVLGLTVYNEPATGGTINVEVTANGSVTATTSADWIKEVTTRGMQTEQRTFEIAENTSTVARTATITFMLNQLSQTVTVNQAGVEVQPIEKTAQAVAREMYPGWNLGNTMEPPVNGLNAETNWQPTVTTQQIIDYVKSLGFKSVRVPCSWNCHMTNGQIDPQWTARVKEIVDYCINDGLYVVLNDHWDNGWIETDGFTNLGESNVSAKEAALRNLWTQIATTFRDYDEHLLFAGLNEPNCDNQAKTDALLRYEQAFIEAVRATGGNNAQRILIVQGPSTDIDNTDKYYDVTRLNDTVADALMVEVHYYTPWNFCGMEKDESWGKMFFYWGSGNHHSGSSYNANWGEENDLRAQFQKMKTKFVDKGIPVYIGEYGCQWRDLSAQSAESQEKHDASVKLFHKLVNQYAGNYGMVPVVWDINYNNQSGIKGVMTVLNRRDCSIYCQPAMDGITEGVQTAVWPY